MRSSTASLYRPVVYKKWEIIKNFMICTVKEMGKHVFLHEIISIV